MELFIPGNAQDYSSAGFYGIPYIDDKEPQNSDGQAVLGKCLVNGRAAATALVRLWPCHNAMRLVELSARWAAHAAHVWLACAMLRARRRDLAQAVELHQRVDEPGRHAHGTTQFQRRCFIELVTQLRHETHDVFT